MFVDEGCGAGGGQWGRRVGGGWAGDEGYGFEGGGGGLLEEFMEDGGAEGASGLCGGWIRWEEGGMGGGRIGVRRGLRWF